MSCERSHPAFSRFTFTASQYIYSTLSIHCEPGLAGVYWSKGWWRWWWQLDYWSYKLCKAPVKSSPPTNQHPVFFTGRMPFLSPNQQCQSTEGKNITFHELAHPKLIWGLPTLSLTTNSSWLPWEGCHASHQPSDTPAFILHCEPKNGATSIFGDNCCNCLTAIQC